MSIELDEFFKGLDMMNTKVQEAGRRGIEKACDDLGGKAEKLAPMKEGELREGMEINTKVHKGEGRVVGEVVFSARAKGGWFNYAAKLHEMGEFDDPTTPGTYPKFLEAPLKQNSERYKQMIADEIRKELG